MRSKLLTAALLCATVAAAQTTAKKPAEGTRNAKSTAASGLPSRVTVNAFLKAMFGWQPTTTWTVGDIKALPGSQVADVTVTLNDKKEGKSVTRRMYVLPGHRFAVATDKEATPFETAVTPKMMAGTPTKQAVEDWVRKYALKNQSVPLQTEINKEEGKNLSQVIVRISTPQGQQSGMFYVTADGNYVLTGEVVPFGADPFAHNRTLLAKANGPSKGAANAAVTIVEFSDLQCPACRSAQPTLDKLVAEMKDVKLVFQNFPLDQLHPWAFRAASYADCVGRENNDAFWAFVEKIYGAQSTITVENVDGKSQEFAAQSGIAKDKLMRCVDDASTKSRVWASQALGRELQITGTPTVFVNGRKVDNAAGVSAETLKAIIQNMKSAKR